MKGRLKQFDAIDRAVGVGVVVSSDVGCGCGFEIVLVLG